MIAYLDSSVLLRIVLGQKGKLKEWKLVRTGVVSALAEVECLRTLDRLRFLHGLSDAELARRREAVFRATHDTALATAARACGLSVVGV